MPIESQPLAQAIARDQPSQDVNVHLIVNKCFAEVLWPDPQKNGSLLVDTLYLRENSGLRSSSKVENGGDCWHNLYLGIYVMIIAFWAIKAIYLNRFLFLRPITRKSTSKMSLIICDQDERAAIKVPPLRITCRGDIQCKSATFPATPLVPSATPNYDKLVSDWPCIMPSHRNACRGDIQCKSATFPATPLVPSATPNHFVIFVDKFRMISTS